MANSWNPERDFEEVRDGHQQWRVGNHLIACSWLTWRERGSIDGI